jgi:hypothetical protein
MYSLIPNGSKIVNNKQISSTYTRHNKIEEIEKKEKKKSSQVLVCSDHLLINTIACAVDHVL